MNNSFANRTSPTRTDVLMSVYGLPRQISSSLLSCCWTCQIYMIDLTKFCSGGCSQKPARRRFRRKRKESEGRYSTLNCRQKTEDARCRVCGNVRKQVSQMWRGRRTLGWWQHILQINNQFVSRDTLSSGALVVSPGNIDPVFRAGKTN